MNLLNALSDFFATHLKFDFSIYLVFMAAVNSTLPPVNERSFGAWLYRFANALTVSIPMPKGPRVELPPPALPHDPSVTSAPAVKNV